MTAPTVEELLDETAIGCGLHRWAVEGGSIEVSTSELRPVLEEAYDPIMPDWAALISYDDGEFYVA